MPIFYNLFQKTEAEVILHYMRLTLIPIPDKDITRKLQASIAQEHRCKNVQQMLANQIQKKYKKIYHNQAGFIPSMQGQFNTGKSINVIHQINHYKKIT